MTDNPFAVGYVEPEPKPDNFRDDFDLGAAKPRVEKPAADHSTSGAMLTAPGAYPGISIEDYHGNPNLLPGPSLSSSGIKTLLEKSPAHFWMDSALNPNRSTERSSPALNLGKAIHDALLLPDRWSNEFYHTTPNGFSPAHHVKWADHIPAWRAAVAAGKVILTADDVATVNRMADAVRAHELATSLLISGTPELTLVWQDEPTGVWLRVRPDVTPDMRSIVPDVKSDINPSPEAFMRKADTYRYFHSAALYLDGLDAIYGPEPGWAKRRFVFVVIEKSPPFTVTLYQAEDEDIERARMENRRAINLFARCLREDRWPGYSDTVLPLGLPGWTRKRIDAEAENGILSYHDA